MRREKFRSNVAESGVHEQNENSLLSADAQLLPACTQTHGFPGGNRACHDVSRIAARGWPQSRVGSNDRRTNRSPTNDKTIAFGAHRGVRARVLYVELR